MACVHGEGWGVYGMVCVAMCIYAHSCGNVVETVCWSPFQSSSPCLLPLAHISFELDAAGSQGEEWAPRMAAYVMMMILYVLTLLRVMLLEAEPSWSSVGTAGGGEHLRLCV